MSLHTVKLTDRNLYLNSAGKSYRIGTMGETDDGRLFRYALVGGSNIVASVLCQSRATQTSWDTIVVPTATAAKDTKINVTDQTNTWNKDELENGYLICETDPGNTGPNSWRIHGNDAVNLTNDFNIYLAEGAIIGQIVGTSDTMHILPSPYSKVIVYPTTKTGMAVGFTMLALTSTRYGWLQTGGIGAARYKDGAASDFASDAGLGQGLIPSTEGAGTIENVTADAQLQVVAQAITTQGFDDDDVLPVFITIE